MPTLRENFIAYLWIKWDNFKFHYMPWTKRRKIYEEIKRLEINIGDKKSF